MPTIVNFIQFHAPLTKKSISAMFPLFSSIFVKKFSRNEISLNFAKISKFLHDFHIFAKIEKLIFVSTLVVDLALY
jgi:hypothetical protein